MTSLVRGQKAPDQNRVQIAKVYPVFANSRLSLGNHCFQKPLVFRDKQGIRRLSEMRHGTTEPKGLKVKFAFLLEFTMTDLAPSVESAANLSAFDLGVYDNQFLWNLDQHLWPRANPIATSRWGLSDACTRSERHSRTGSSGRCVLRVERVWTCRCDLGLGNNPPDHRSRHVHEFVVSHVWGSGV